MHVCVYLIAAISPSGLAWICELGTAISQEQQITLNFKCMDLPACPQNEKVLLVAIQQLK